jgi:hypothetical protein
VAIFWWTGKGYLTAVIVLAVFSAFGIALPIGSPFLKETPVYWGLAGVVAAVVVWLVGRRVNAKAIASVRSIHCTHPVRGICRRRGESERLATVQAVVFALWLRG